MAQKQFIKDGVRLPTPSGLSVPWFSVDLVDKEVAVKSINDGIEVNASKKTVLQSGQPSLTSDGWNITFAFRDIFRFLVRLS
ncbi:hypothetical protein [Massilia sp.]|uniref:hypothetical protein n=1 Tax=Massilia sp. TaxID=1882437 RepID=UPI00352C2BA8